MEPAGPARAVRRLAAILAADVVGYSRLMGADEEGTLERLKALRRELIDPKIAEHHGRIIKTTGDGLLVEFASVVDAVRCAVEVQQAIAERNTAVASDSRIELRIGINLGDVIVEGEDLYGDGVNIAARIEALADAGGVFVSSTVYDQMRDRLPFAFEDLGDQQVKNIARPLRVYRVRGTAAQSPVAPALPLPDKPSIAVLPFANMSGDPEQEYFVDGMVEEIITALSKVRWFFVIARNSSFTYKGRAVDVKQVGRELGVRYVLEGSVRKAGTRVRITAQLIEAASGNHLWAERYDREIIDIFAVQDDITERVVATLEPELYAAEYFRSQRKPPDSLDAWECNPGAILCRPRDIGRERASRGAVPSRPPHRPPLQPRPELTRVGALAGPPASVTRGSQRGDCSTEFRRARCLGTSLSRDSVMANATTRRSGAGVPSSFGFQPQLRTGSCLSRLSACHPRSG
jgi:adenylate cyclase